jgi:hypothetical protein
MTIKSQGGIFGRNPEFNNISNVGSAALKNLTTTDSALNISSSAADGSVTINASGNVGVGGSGTNTVTNGLAVNNATAGNYPGYEIQTADTTRFYINASDAASYIVSVGTSPMVFFTNGGEAARFNSSKNLAFPSGQGIDFSATAGTGTSELFDDYEEGTWTPTVTPATGSLTSYNSEGFYTKIGRHVNLYFYFQITSIGSAADAATVTGLPFTASASSAAKSAGAASENAISGVAGVTHLQSATSILVKDRNGATPFAASAYWMCSISYFV